MSRNPSHWLGKKSPVPRHRRGPINKAGDFGAVSYLVTSKATLFIRELDGLFAGEVINLEAQEQNAIQRFVDFVLQAGLVVGGVSAAQLSQGLHLLVGVLEDVDAAKGDHAPEVGRELGGPDVILLDDAERASVVAPDGIDFVPLHGRMENDSPVGIDITEGHGVRVAAVTRQR